MNLHHLADIKTHKHNIMAGRLSPHNNNVSADTMSSKALYMSGRKENSESLMNTLLGVFEEQNKDYVLVRGPLGSGKSLFVRKTLHDFINEKLKPFLRYLNLTFSNGNRKFIFASYQKPNTFNDSLNGWNHIMREMYRAIKDDGIRSSKFSLKIGTEIVNINCDEVGEMILSSDCFSYIRYLEEILNVNC
jgi:Cdc6-like AAA superfamily ATPase